MMSGATARGTRRLPGRVSAIAAGAFLAACGAQVEWVGAPGSLAKPVLVIVGEFESAPDIAIADPAFAAAISRRMSGLTDYSIRSETARRAGATVRQQLVASLRAGGLPAEAADIESARGDIVNLLVTGRLRSLDDAVLRQRKLAPAGAGRSRIVADIKVVHAGIALDAKTLVSFEAEDNAAAGRPAPQAAAVSAAPGVAPEPISADLDAHLRRIGAAAAERILVKAAGRDGRNRPVRRAPRVSGLRAVS